MTRRNIFLALALLLLALPQASAQVRLETQIDSTKYRIGDWIRVRVIAEMPSSVSSISPFVKDSLGPFEVLRVHSLKPESEEGGTRQVWIFRLTTFDAGNFTIPPIEFGYTLGRDTVQNIARSQPIQVTISGVEVDQKGDIKDIKDPLRPPWAFEDFIPSIIALLILSALGGAYAFYRWWMKKKEGVEEEAQPQIPAHEQALISLRELEDKKLWQQGKVKEYYSEVTEIIRRFFEGRFAIVALEMTSYDILQQLKSIPEAQPLLKEIDTFLLTADLVKFAKYTATPPDHEHELQCAYEIVRAMIPKPPVEEEAGAEVTADVR